MVGSRTTGVVTSTARRSYHKHSLTSPGPVSLYNTGSNKRSLVPAVSVSFCRRVLDPASKFISPGPMTISPGRMSLYHPVL